MAGAAGGLVASFAMNQFQFLWTKLEKAGAEDQRASDSAGDDATVKAANTVSLRLFDHELTNEEKQWAGPAVHYAFGALMGAVYGLLACRVPAGAAYAAAYGSAVWLGADEIGVPALGLAQSPAEIPLSAHIKALASHIVYGVIADLTRGAILGSNRTGANGSDRLATYLHDHLAGSHFAVELLNSLADRYRNEDLGDFAVALCAEIKKDQDSLEDLIARVGRAHFDLAEATGWLAEKASQLKLQSDSRCGLGTFEALETLALGVQGKLALWRALPTIRKVDARIPHYDFERLAARAEEQYQRIEEQRQRLASVAFQRIGSIAS